MAYKHIEIAIKSLEAQLDELFDYAENVVEEHWQKVREKENERPGWQNRSDLSLRVRRKGNALMLEWRKIKWVGSKAKGNRQAIAEYLRRPKEGYGYSMNVLGRLAKDWEKPLVEKTEAKLTEIRRRWRHITKAMQLLNVAKA